MTIYNMKQKRPSNPHQLSPIYNLNKTHKRYKDCQTGHSIYYLLPLLQKSDYNQINQQGGQQFSILRLSKKQKEYIQKQLTIAFQFRKTTESHLIVQMISSTIALKNQLRQEEAHSFSKNLKVCLVKFKLNHLGFIVKYKTEMCRNFEVFGFCEFN